MDACGTRGAEGRNLLVLQASKREAMFRAMEDTKVPLQAPKVNASNIYLTARV